MSSVKNIVLLASLLSMLNLSNGQENRLTAVRHPVPTNIARMRCTRRFSPGVCVDEVAPVWTFVFQTQNCTERLGCPNNYRTNRFKSYRMCMRRCRSFIQIYLHMVRLEETSATNIFENDTSGRTDMVNKVAGDSILREGFTTEGITVAGDKKEDLFQDVEDEEYTEDGQDTHMVVYKDINVNEDILLPDVDYVGGHIRSEFDLLHW